MKRVAFIIPQLDHNWTGGINYYRSLLYSLEIQTEKQFSPVIIVQPSLKTKAVELFPGVEVRSTLLLKWLSPLHIARKLVVKITRRDFLLELYLLHLKIDISSHGPALGENSRIPNLCWIPDFQYLHLPNFFDEKEISIRTKRNKTLAADSTALIVSSYAAKNDAEKIIPGVGSKIAVLRFVPRISGGAVIPLLELELKYDFTGKYIFLPNQFWAHKNHRIVVEALAHINKMSTTRVKIICTGSTADYRNPRHFDGIKSLVSKLGVMDQFRILGMVPYDDMFSLMYHSHAVINPSLFEGWSTTVEEAKLLKKKLILSFIDVHHEQAAGVASFFNSTDSVDCAEVILQSWAESSDIVAEDYLQKAVNESLVFGAKYCSIIKNFAK